jgi:SWIM/SEC-C metal-binding protein
LLATEERSNNAVQRPRFARRSPRPFGGTGAGVNEEDDVAKLGTTQRPAVLRVQSMERADEVMAIAERNGWKVIVGVEPDKPENTADLETLMQGGAAPIRRAQTVGRNDPCPCGSGRKLKRCCGQ